MPIVLGREAKPQPPVLKKSKIGEKFLGVVVRETSRNRTRDGQVVLKRDSDKPAKQLVVTLLTIGSTQSVSLGEDTHVPEPGEMVRLIEQGGGYASWIEAVRGLNRPLQVGDVLQFECTHAELFDTDGKPLKRFDTQEQVVAQRMKGGSIGFRGSMVLRAPAPSEAEWVTKAEAAYMMTADSIPATGSPADDVDPF